MVSSTCVLPLKIMTLPAQDLAGSDNGAYVNKKSNAEQIILFLIFSVPYLAGGPCANRMSPIPLPSHQDFFNADRPGQLCKTHRKEIKFPQAKHFLGPTSLLALII